MQKVEFGDIARQVGDCARTGRVLLERDARLVFVFGAKPNPGRPGARDYFVTYARKHIPWAYFFLAEDYFEVYSGDSAYDLLSIEEDLADYSDCLLLFLESESTIAELGAFAIDNKLCKNMVVVNEALHRGSDSFIAKGPLAKIERKSSFGAPIYVGMEHVLTIVAEVEGRLERLRGYRARHIDVESSEAFNDEEPKNRMLFLYQIVLLLAPVRFGELIGFLESMYGKKGGYKVDADIDMLKTLGLLGLREGHLVPGSREPERFIRFSSLDHTKLRATVVRRYHMVDRRRLRLLVRG